MRAVLFEGTPEEFARVEAMFRAGGDPTVQTRSIVLSRPRPKTWPELNEDHSHRLARRALEMMPEHVGQALGQLAEVQALHGEQMIEGWAEHTGQLPEELCGYLAELARCTSRAFIELFGCENAPQRVRGAADMLLQKAPSKEGAYFVIRPGLMRAMAELDAATRRTEVDAAAKKLHRAKAELQHLEAKAPQRSKRRSSRGSGSAGAAS